MTGYAITTLDSSNGTLTVELKSVNSRFLDLQFRINDELRSFEAGLRDVIIAKLTRGKVECRVSFGRKAASGQAQHVNSVLLGELAQLQTTILQQFSGAAPFSVAELLRWPGVVEEPAVSNDNLQTELQQAMAQTLAGFIDSRAREGAALQTMLLSRVEAMESIVARITPLIPQIIANFQQKAVERMQEALSLASSGPQSQPEIMERIRQEVDAVWDSDRHCRRTVTPDGAFGRNPAYFEKGWPSGQAARFHDAGTQSRSQHHRLESGTQGTGGCGDGIEVID